MKNTAKFGALVNTPNADMVQIQMNVFDAQGNQLTSFVFNCSEIEGAEYLKNRNAEYELSLVKKA